MLHLTFMILLLITGMVDLRTRKIYNLFPFLIALLAVCRMIYDPACIWPGIVGCLIASVLLLLLTLRFGGLGGGDIKLTAACGLYLGVDDLLIGLLIACSLALVFHFICHLYEKRHRKRNQLSNMIHPHSFAFGPYLAIGFMIALLIS